MFFLNSNMYVYVYVHVYVYVYVRDVTYAPRKLTSGWDWTELTLSDWSATEYLHTLMRCINEDGFIKDNQFYEAIPFLRIQ